MRLGDLMFDTAVEWVRTHRRKGKNLDAIVVTLFGPNGEALRKVMVPQGDGNKEADSSRPS